MYFDHLQVVLEVYTGQLVYDAERDDPKLVKEMHTRYMYTMYC